MILDAANSIKFGSSHVDRVYHGENFQFLGHDFSHTTDGSIVNGDGTYSAAGDPLLTDLIINYSIVGAEAFTGCSNLTGVILTNNVQRVMEETFRNCGITDLTIGRQVFFFGDQCFQNNAFTNVSLPTRSDQAMAFEGATFKDCSNLTGFTLPENCDSICDDMLRNCTSLTDVFLPSTLQVIGTSAFEDCTSLTGVHFQNLREIHQSAFNGCTSLTTIDIPSADVIESAAFSSCTALTTFNIRTNIPPGRHQLGHSSYPGMPIDFLPSHLTEIHVPSGAPYTYVDNEGNTKNGWQNTFFSATVIRDL